MSLSHEFFLIPSDIEFNNRIEWYYLNRKNWKDIVVISDDLILYLLDTLNWIISYNPETKKLGTGLVYHGITIINNNGSTQLESIVNSWMNLFRQGPDLISLRGQTVWKEDESGEGYFEVERIRKSKKDIFKELNDLKEMASRTANGEYIIIHFGI